MATGIHIPPYSSDEGDCHAVLRHYKKVVTPIPTTIITIHRVEAGFSPARVWKIEASESAWALRCWGPPGIEVARVQELHRWLGHLRASGLPVAVPITAESGDSLVRIREDFWQLEPWMPGNSPGAMSPDSPDTRVALQCLAQLHVASSQYVATGAGSRWFRVGRGPCPALRERLDQLAQWTPAEFRNCRQLLAAAQKSASLDAARNLLQLAERMVDPVSEALRSVAGLEVPLAPCLRDLRPDHVLFTEGRVTGIIDPAAARTETVATDLTRLLAGYFSSDGSRLRELLQVYESVRPLSESERRLLPHLDRSNVLLSGLHWTRLCADGAVGLESPLAVGRIQHLLQRMQQIVP